MNKDIKICLIGRGSIGKRHLKNLLALGYKNIIAFSNRYDKVKTIQFEKEFGVQTINNLEKLETFQPKIFFICNPTSLHEQAMQLAIDHGAHIFVEKPISHALGNLEKIKTELIKKKLLLFQANCLRFHPVIKGIKELLANNEFGNLQYAKIFCGGYFPDWHPSEDYHVSYVGKKELGGGAVLTLQHEIDYVYWFFGELKNLCSITKKISDLDINVEDSAEILAESNTCPMVNIHLNIFQRPHSRKIQIFGNNASLTYQFGDPTLRLYNFNNKNYKEFFYIGDYDTNQMYIDEVKHFFNCLDGNDTPLVGIDEAIYTLKTCLEIKKEL